MLNSSFGASVFAGGYPGASVPAAAGASPQGPRTIGQQAFGIVSGVGDGDNTAFYAAIGGGTLALGLLIFLWWSLPR